MKQTHDVLGILSIIAILVIIVALVYAGIRLNSPNSKGLNCPCWKLQTIPT